MKRSAQKVVIGLVVSLLSTLSMAGIQSLRGDNPLDKGENPLELKKQVTAQGGFERNYKQQPPLIPHSIEKDKLTLKENSCLRCHSQENFEREKAPKVGDSHFVDRDGKKLEKMSSRRWFCTQCHAPQVDAQPLVENNFKK